jgi:hypothetical protein
MTQPRDFYDVHTPLMRKAPGVLMTREIEAALLAQYAANGYTPLTTDQVLAITGTPPAYPSGMPRFLDSNPASDGWAIDNPLAGGSR